MHDAPSLPGTTIGQYRIVRVIGEGGMGVVYEAVHVTLKKPVALKTLPHAGARSSDALERFMREGEVAARLRHPNVVDITDFGIHEGTPYLVMELLEGESLAAKIARGRLPLPLALELLLPVFAAVQTAHDEAIVHRDLKPQNIFLAKGRLEEVTPKLLDFGISKFTDPTRVGPALTNTQALLGTPYYMSPEQVRGAKLLDAMTDQYSLGVILYECVTGRVPFKEDHLFQLFSEITLGTYPRPSSLVPNLPEGFEPVLSRALQREKSERFPSVSAFALALVPFAAPNVRARWESVFRSVGREHVASEASRLPSDGASDLPGAMAEQAATNGSLSRTDSSLGAAPRSRRTLFFLGVVGSVTLAGGALAFIGLSSRSSLPTSGAEPSALPPVTRPSSAPPQESPSATTRVEPPAPLPSYWVRTRVVPSEASILVDGKLVGTGTVELEFAKDGTEHTLVIQAPRFESFTSHFRDEPPPGEVTLKSRVDVRRPVAPKAQKISESSKPPPVAPGDAAARDTPRTPSPPLRTAPNNSPILR